MMACKIGIKIVSAKFFQSKNKKKAFAENYAFKLSISN